VNEISAGGHYEAVWYEIRLKGHLDSRWTAWFHGLSLAQESDGTTLFMVLSPTRQHSMACSRECVTLPCH
jgi:hypothetical protein